MIKITKLLIIPSNKETINNVLNITDGVILGIKGLSVNLPFYLSINEIKEISALTTKEIFISLNKNMHNQDLVYLEKTLLELESLNIKGILYYDVSIVNIKNRLNLKIPLVWAQEHFTTNSVTSNYWYEFGVNYTFISSEITLEEIITINKETNAELLVNIFGYLPVFVSKRDLVFNYTKTFKLKTKSKLNYIEHDADHYPLITDENGTMGYSAKILNGCLEFLKLKENNIAYAVLNGFNISATIFLKIIKLYQELNNDNFLIIKEKIDELLEYNTNQGFFHQETIYKVKNNE